MQNTKLKLDHGRIKDLILAASPFLLILVLFVFITYRFVDPAPPKHLKITAGDPSGRYFSAAKSYQESLKKAGIDLEVLPSKGGWENLHRLEDKASGIEIGFMQDGLGDRKKAPDLTSLGSLYYEPIWIFYRRLGGGKRLDRVSQLVSKRIAVGEHGGETHSMAMKLLGASGVTDKNSTLVEGTLEDGAAKLKAGLIDAAFFTATAEDPVIHDLLIDPKLELMSLDQAEGTTRQFPYLHHLTLPHGSIDLGRNIPDHDIELVGATATLIARKSMHPALVYLILKAASHEHHRAGVFEKKWEFPMDKDYVFPVNDGARDYFKTGAPFWIKYLPFWLAVLMERFIFLVLPTMAIVIPLLKLIPRFLNWRVRSRIHQGYGELKLLEDRIRPEADKVELTEYVSQLDGIEKRINQMRFPVDVFDDVYILREHIHFVRERLTRMQRAG